MARRPITQDLWESLLDSFRAAPGAIGVAARRTGLDKRTVSKAWHRGLPPWDSGRPIEKILQDEQVSARARLLREQEEASARARHTDDLAEAREQAIEARKAEGAMVKLGRSNAVQVLAATADLLRSARALAQRCRDKLDQMLNDDKAASDGAACEWCGRGPSHVSAAEIVNLLDRVTLLSKRVNEQALEAMKMERLHLGEPTEILGWGGDEDIPTSEAETRLKVAAKAVEAALRRRAAREALADEPLTKDRGSGSEPN